MSKKILGILVVIILLAVGTTCGYKNITAPSKTPNQSETTSSDTNSSSSGTSSSNSSGNDPDLVIKTENRASEKEADEMLKEVDRQLDSLIKALDELDTVDTKELPE